MRSFVLHRLPVSLLLVSLALAGCAASTSSTPRTNAPITADDLRHTAATTVLAAVRDLRPQWLNRLEGAFLEGSPVSMRQLEQESLRGVAEIRFLSAEQATSRYGTRTLSGSFLDVARRW